MTIAKPTTYLNWTDGDVSKVVQPPTAQLLSGWTVGEPPPFEYMNWLFYETDQWIKWLDQNLNSDSSLFESVTQCRLINGGNWSWDLSTSTLAWDAIFNISIPSIADIDNQAAIGNAVIPDGSVAYIQANIPYNLTGDTLSGSNLITNVTNPLSLVPGMAVTGTGIPAATTIISLIDEGDGQYTVQISNNATATNVGIALTFAKNGALTVAVADIASLVLGPTTLVIARRTGNYIYVGVNTSQMVLQNKESKPLNQNGYINVVPMVCGETLAYGDAVYISAGAGDGGRTLGRAYKVDTSVSNGDTRNMFIGFVIIGNTAGNAGYVVEGGNLVTSGLVAGSLYYSDPAIPGSITSTKPTTTNQWVTPVGTALSTTLLGINSSLAATSQKIQDLSLATVDYEGIYNLTFITSVALNALTVALKDLTGSADCSLTNAATVAFMNSADLVSGGKLKRLLTAASSLVVPSGATLGMTNAVATFLYIYLLDNAGTIELAISGKGDYDESSLQSTTAISGASSSATILYSAAARTNVCIRLLGRILISEATAGTWVTNSTTNYNGYILTKGNPAYVDKAASYTLSAITDDTIDFTAVATATLPTAVGIQGKQFTILNSVGGYNVTINTTASQTINNQAAGGGIILSKSGNFITVMSDGANWFIVKSSIASTVQRFLSGSGTYNRPQGVRSIIVTALGGGAGGGGGGGASSNGSAGNDTTFGTSLLIAPGGAAGANASTSPTINSPAVTIMSQLGMVGANTYQFAVNFLQQNGPTGGMSVFGGAGPANSGTGAAAQANSGSGGAGAGISGYSAITQFVGPGSGSGGFIKAQINSPSDTYSYSVGAGGAGAPVSGGTTVGGGAGGSGIIIVEETYF
jgi:hypothetical protein